MIANCPWPAPQTLRTRDLARRRGRRLRGRLRGRPHDDDILSPRGALEDESQRRRGWFIALKTLCGYSGPLAAAPRGPHAAGRARGARRYPRPLASTIHAPGPPRGQRRHDSTPRNIHVVAAAESIRAGPSSRACPRPSSPRAIRVAPAAPPLNSMEYSRGSRGGVYPSRPRLSRMPSSVVSSGGTRGAMSPR